MNWSDIKKSIDSNGIIFWFSSLLLLMRVIDRLFPNDYDNFKKFNIIKLKTEKYRIVIIDDDLNSPLILVRPKGFLKKWLPLETTDMPQSISAEITDKNCLPREKGEPCVEVDGSQIFLVIL